MTLNILGDVKAPLTQPDKFLKQAVPAYNAAVESYRESGDAKPAESVLEAAAIRDTLAEKDGDEIHNFGQNFLDQILGIEGADAVVLLDYFEKCVTVLQNEKAWYVHQCVEYATAEGREDSSSGDYEEFADARQKIDLAFSLLGQLGAVEKVTPLLKFKKNEKGENTEERDDKLDLRNIPQGLKPTKNDTSGKRGRKPEVLTVRYNIDEQDIPRGTIVEEMLARYMPLVSREEFFAAWKNLKEETKNEDGGWTRVLRIPGHDVTVTKEGK